MVKIRDFNLPIRYLGWFLFIYLLLFCISGFYVVFNKDFFINWFYLVHPGVWMIFYITLSYKHNIFERSSFILGAPSIILIFAFDMCLFTLTNPEILPILFPITIISAMIYIGICFLSFLVGFFLSLIITKIPEIKDSEILKNSVSFQLEGDESQKKATNNLLTRTVRKYLRYPFWVDSQKFYEVYVKLNPFSVKRLFITSDMDKISFYPFIKDGFYQEPNSKPISLITLIGTNIFNLKTSKSHAKTLLEEFSKHVKPNKILRLLKNIRHRDIAIVGILILAIAIGLTFTLYPEFILINLNTLFYNVLFWFGSTIVAIIAREIWENKKQKKSK